MRNYFRKCYPGVILFLFFVICLQSNSLAGDVTLNNQQMNELKELLKTVDNNTGYFKKGELTNDRLIVFGLSIGHSSKYASQTNKKGSGNYLLPSSYVDNLVMKYFGKKVIHISTQEHPFKNGNYILGVGDAGVPVDIKIEKVDSRGNDLYRVYHKSMPEDAPEQITKERAIVKLVNSEGKKHFIILELQKAQ